MTCAGQLPSCLGLLSEGLNQVLIGAFPKNRGTPVIPQTEYGISVKGAPPPPPPKKKKKTDASQER